MRAKTAPLSSARSLRRINTHTASTPRTTSTRPDQSCAGRAAEMQRRSPGSLSPRKPWSPKGRRRRVPPPRHAWRWHGRYGEYGLLEPSPRPKRDGPGFLPGFFSYLNFPEWSRSANSVKNPTAEFSQAFSALRVTKQTTGCTASCGCCRTRRELQGDTVHAVAQPSNSPVIGKHP
jgi:hypothetical protein